MLPEHSLGIQTQEPARGSQRIGLIPVVVAAIALLAMALLPASAGAYLYWADDATDSIVRANLDGTGINPSFVTGASTPVGVALDSEHVYWANNTGFSVGRAALDGTDVDQSLFTVTTLKFPRGVAVTADHIFVGIGSSEVARADIDGSDVNEGFIPGAATPVGVAVNDQYLFWANAGSIGRADLDGDPANGGFIGGVSPGFVAADDDHVYWSDQAAGKIGRADVAGTNANQDFITGASGPRGVAVDDEHIYWLNTNGTIGRANLDGSAVNQSFISGVTTAGWGLAVDALTPPATEIDSVDLDAGKRRAAIAFASSQPNSTFTCKLDSRDYKACDSPKVYKHLDDGRHTARVVARNAQNADDPTPAKVRFRF